MHRSFLDSVPKCLRHWCRSILGHFGTSAKVSRSNCPGAEVSRLFLDLVPKCLKTLKPKCLVRIVLVPKCPDFSSIWCRSVLRHEVSRPNCPGAEVSRFFSIWCRSVLRHFGTSAEVSRTMFWCRSVLRHFGTGAEVSRAGPKCLVAEVSGNRSI